MLLPLCRVAFSSNRGADWRPFTFGQRNAGSVSRNSRRKETDAARIRVGVLSEGASPTEVAQENATRMSSVVDAVKKAVGEPALSSGTVEVRTDAVILTPIYADRGSHPIKATVNGYRANNRLRILVRELGQRSPGFLGAIIEQANKGPGERDLRSGVFGL